MDTVHVFCNTQNEFGNPLGIVIDDQQNMTDSERQLIATKSGYSEVVFISNLNEAIFRIFTPQNEIPFAGHAVIGVAYYISQKIGRLPSQLQVGHKEIEVYLSDNVVWIKTDLSNLPPWNFNELSSPKAVEDLPSETALTLEHALVWSWINEENGIVRARTFANDWGIPEDEANGSGAMKLTELLGKNLTVNHGKGSVIHTKIGEAGSVHLGGRVTMR